MRRLSKQPGPVLQRPDARLPGRHGHFHTTATVARLRAMLEAHRQSQLSGGEGAHSAKSMICTGIRALDAALPHGGFEPGTVTECLQTHPGAGATRIALKIALAAVGGGRLCPPPQTGVAGVAGVAGGAGGAGGAGVALVCEAAQWESADLCPNQNPGRQVRGQDISKPVLHTGPPLGPPRRIFDVGGSDLADHAPVVLIDADGDLYPPALAHMGFNPASLVIIRPTSAKEAFWAADQALRCRAVGAVVATLKDLDDVAGRRLQLAAEIGGGLGIFLRPADRVQKSFAAVQMLIEPMSPWQKGTGSEPSVVADAKSRGSRGACPLLSQTAIPDSGLLAPHAANRWNIEANRAQNVAMQSGMNRRGHGSMDLHHHIRRVQITLLRVREGRPTDPFEVELPDEAGFMSIPAIPGNGSIEERNQNPPRQVGGRRAG